jgi:hypothetical protein
MTAATSARCHWPLVDKESKPSQKRSILVILTLTQIASIHRREIAQCPPLVDEDFSLTTVFQKRI